MRDILEKYESFVNTQIIFHTERAKAYRDKPFRSKKHLETAQHLTDLLVAIKEFYEKEEERAEEAAPKNSNQKQYRLSLVAEDLEGLPEELLAELSVSGDKIEFAIIGLLEEAGGVLSMDQIIIGLYRQTNQIHKRPAITNKLYRMKEVRSSSSRKGVYVLNSLSEEKEERIMNNLN